MALVNCPECEADVSESALKCPKCAFQIKEPKRSFMGKLFKWFFIGFNVLMLFLLFSYLGDVGEVSNNAGSDAAQAGVAVGATIGTGMLLSFWVLGDIILGLLVLFTKPK